MGLSKQLILFIALLCEGKVMGEVSFSRTIRVKAICTYCKNDCGRYYFSVGEYNLICFNCVDEMKKQVDKKRYELEEAEIQ